MTTNASLATYKDQINEIAAFARSINFDLNTESVEELVRLWIVRNQEFYKSKNREAVISIVKEII